MSATLDAVEAGLWNELARLLNGYTVVSGTVTEERIDAPSNPTSDRPLRHLRRFAGEVTRALAEDIERGLVSLAPQQMPAALLASVRAVPVGTDGASADTILDLREVVVRSFWRVFVIAQDLRGDGHAMKTDMAGQPAALLASQRVMEILTGLRIPGLHDGDGVRWVGTTVHLVLRRGLYAFAVDFSADATLGAAAASSGGSDGSVPFETMTGENGPEGATDLDPSTIDLTDS